MRGHQRNLPLVLGPQILFARRVVSLKSHERGLIHRLQAAELHLGAGRIGYIEFILGVQAELLGGLRNDLGADQRIEQTGLLGLGSSAVGRPKAASENTSSRSLLTGAPLTSAKCVRCGAAHCRPPWPAGT